MGCGLAAILALTVAAEPVPSPVEGSRSLDPPARPAVKVLAFIGAGLMGVGLGFEITGRAATDPRAPVLEWRSHAQSNTIGGIALIGTGLCLVTIAALLTRWHFPSLALRAGPRGALITVSWP